MTTRQHNLVWLMLVCANFGLAASVWQSAKIAESGRVIEATGIGAFPAITLALLVNLLGLFALRYARGLVRIILAVALAAVSALALFTPAIAPFSSTPVLTTAVESQTGVAGWTEQQATVLSQVSAYSVTSFVFSCLCALLVLWILLAPMTKNTQANTAKTVTKDDLWIN